ERLLARFRVREDELDASIREDEIVPLLRDRWPFPAPNPDALLHGDFWMGNVVWDGDEIAAVIDWEEACVGDPLADLAGARLDFL
ncbi:MAG: phosphotransferase, partial [Actinobacteria bacterium]|nr:phosphotransferase [Actinomycetota bacterium]NIU70494.1 phosphotransferase [Actinomycetota bacterium]NIW32390.1 phosphotransferase [Actinomycetota bacterium]